RGEREDFGFLSGAWRREELLHHDQGAFLVFDHELQEEPIELGALRGGEMTHFVRREHAGHERGTLHVVRMLARNRLAAHLEPALHHSYFVGLRYLDSQREL